MDFFFVPVFDLAGVVLAVAVLSVVVEAVELELPELELEFELLEETAFHLAVSVILSVTVLVQS